MPETMTISGKRRNDSSAAEEVAGNEDLVTEILLRLPVKSLLRFESVSKKWLSLISHPHFAQSYARLHNPNCEPSGILLNHFYAGFQFLPFNGDDDHNRVGFSHPDDPDTECLRTMPMPPFEEDCFDFSGVRYFGESRGHLHITMIPHPSAIEFDIWELETDYSGWLICYRVNLDAVMIAFPLDATQIRDDFTDAFALLHVAREEKEEESTLVLFVSDGKVDKHRENYRKAFLLKLNAAHCGHRLWSFGGSIHRNYDLLLRHRLHIVARCSWLLTSAF